MIYEYDYQLATLFVCYSCTVNENVVLLSELDRFSNVHKQVD